MSGSFRAEVDGDIGVLIIDNPTKRNAMSLNMYAAVPEAVAAVTSCRVVVLRGAGDEAFGAGSNISEFAAKRVGSASAAYNAIESAATAAIAALPMPVIALIHGPCRGGGAGLALAADLRFAADDASFAIPPANLGVGYPVDAVDRLVATVGAAHAKDLILTARVVGAVEAARLGLVNRVFPKADLAAEVNTAATSMALLAPLTLRAAKVAIDGGDATGLTEACYASADFTEGIDAFFKKRPPSFKGH